MIFNVYMKTFGVCVSMFETVMLNGEVCGKGGVIFVTSMCRIICVHRMASRGNDLKTCMKIIICTFGAVCVKGISK